MKTQTLGGDGKPKQLALRACVTTGGGAADVTGFGASDVATVTAGSSGPVEGAPIPVTPAVSTGFAVAAIVDLKFADPATDPVDVVLSDAAVGVNTLSMSLSW